MNRRSFVQFATATCVTSAFHAQSQAKTGDSTRSTPRPLLGVVVRLQNGPQIDAALERVRRMGFPTCHIGLEHLTQQDAAPLKQAQQKHSIAITALSEHNPGRRVFNFYEGPSTIGIVPPATRRARVEALKFAADVAALSGIPAIHTHLGFIPEDPNDPLYAQSVAAVKDIALHCKQKGLVLLCETGEETPITLLRLIHDCGGDNVLVNLDLANLILYGKGNPVDAIDVLGPLIRGTHVKDGLFPTNPRELGQEVPIGKGKVDFPAVLRKLKQLNYVGPLTIEREIEGEQQRKNILDSKLYLEDLLAKIYA